jgi:hypothetical protein
MNPPFAVAFIIMFVMGMMAKDFGEVTRLIIAYVVGTMICLVVPHA